MFFVLAAQGLYVLLFDRKIFLKMIPTYFTVSLLYLPWIPFLYHQLTSVSTSYWIGPIDGRTHYEALMRILAGEQENAVRPLLFGLSILLIVVGLIQHIRRGNFEKPYLLIWLWAVVPFILASLPGLKIGGVKLPFRPIFFWRYLIGSSVPLAMVIVHAGQKLPQKYFKLTMGLLVVMCLVIDWQTFWRSPESFRQVYAQKIVPEIKTGDKIVTVLPSFAEVLYYRNRFSLKNEMIVLQEGLVQFSGKSLLDAYVANGVVMMGNAPSGRYFEARPGPELVIRE
jgi:hypothetical protein